MSEYDVGDIVNNRYYSTACLILEKKYDSNGMKKCVTLLLTSNERLGNKAGEVVTWAGWPSNSSMWSKVA